MTPVEEVKTRDCGTPQASAAAAVIASTASVPPRPVKALALPEFTTMAAPSSEAPPILAWQSSTGAARVAERVNAPATALPGASFANITSVRP